MNAKAWIFLIVGCGMMAVVLHGLTTIFGVALTGPPLGQFVVFVAIAFSGIAIWEFVGSVTNAKR